MARFTRRRKGFRGGKPVARKRTAWVTTTLNDRIIASHDGEFPEDDYRRRLILLTASDWVSNESLSETATLIRVVSSVQVTLCQRYGTDVGVGSGTWQVHQPVIGVLGLFDISDLFGSVSGTADSPSNPDYYLETDVLKVDQVMLGSSGSVTVGLGGVEAAQDTRDGQTRELSLSSKVRRRLKVDSVLGLEYCLGEPFPSPTNPNGMWNLYPDGMQDLGDWEVRLTGIVRMLVQFG